MTPSWVVACLPLLPLLPPVLSVCNYGKAGQNFLGAPGDKCSNWQIGDSWNNGYVAHLIFTADHEVHGWVVNLRFDAPIDGLDCFAGEVAPSQDGASWSVTPCEWDGDFQPGDTIDIPFQVLFSSPSPPDLESADLDGHSICGAGPPVTTTTPATTTTAEDTTTSTGHTTTTQGGGGEGCGEIITIESEEEGAWHGLVVITVDSHVLGWEVHLAFNEVVDSIESPLVTVSGSRNEWKLHSKGFDEELQEGQTLELRFKTLYSGAHPNITAVGFNGVVICSSEVPGPTTGPPGGDCGEVFLVESQEVGSWHGLLTLIAEEDIEDWKAILGFDYPIDSIETPLGEVTGSGTSWTISSKSFDSSLPAGYTLELRFKVTYSGEVPTITSIRWNEEGMCRGGSSAAPTQTTSSSHPTNHPGKYPYGEVIAKSLLFYEAERSGPLPSDNRVPWRGDSALGDEVLGGYYDAGDHVKFGFPMAAMTTILAWGGSSFYEGYKKAGQLEWMDSCIKWSTDYFMLAHKSGSELVGQVGDGDADHAWWGRPEEMTMDRPSWSITASAPGSDLAAETAAALAAAAVYFTRRGDTAYSATLLSHARSLFEFADTHRGVYTEAIPNAQNFYASWSGYEDELMWAAAWLAKATGESSYLDKAEGFYNEFPENQGRPGEFSWDDKTAGAQLLLWQLTGRESYRGNVQEFLDYIWSCSTTPKGLIWLESSQWGSLRYAADLAHFTLQAALAGVDVDNSIGFAEAQINYILGDTGRSYVCGYGTNPPVKPHHRGSSCPSSGVCDWNSGYNNPGPNHQVLQGALVGGPDKNDNYVDDRTNFQTNEVATDYNAGFQSALAGLNKIYG